MAADMKTLPERWAKAWCSDDPEPWLDLYQPSAMYIDHAFRIRRSGRKILQRHHNLWRTANPDFIMEIDPAWPVWWRDVDEEKGNGKASFRTINRGTFMHDLPTKKASGNPFEFRGVIDLVIEGGLIRELNEYYTGEFDKSAELSKYHTLDETSKEDARGQTDSLRSIG